MANSASVMPGESETTRDPERPAWARFRQLAAAAAEHAEKRATSDPHVRLMRARSLGFACVASLAAAGGIGGAFGRFGVELVAGF